MTNDIIKAIKTGELKKDNGLVEYVAEGYIIRDNERIPCEIGYSYLDRLYYYRPEFIFIREGYTESGSYYESETIALDGSCHYSADYIDREEV